MSLGEIIYTILIGPLELFFEVVFVIANRHVSNPAYAIILLSLAMNFLVLPLYRRADALQAEERDRENKLAPWIKHIKKTFKGDERFMMLQAYYKENNYKPTDSLKGSISLLLEIPFFIAAYHFLSNLEVLRGVSFGPITDLGAPDALISVGTFTINLLPILMTLINVISAAIYMKGFPIKNKIQMYGIAAIFLVFLYKSPAGLVFYWTLNNVFSLIKNAFYKLRNPAKVLRILSSAVGAVLLILVIIKHPMGSNLSQAFVIIALLAMQLPMIPHNKNPKWALPENADYSGVFYGATITLTILAGVLIPSAVINDSTQEFVDPAYYVSPIWYIVSAAAFAFGTFIVWLGVFYRLSSRKGKQTFAFASAIIMVCALCNYMFFGRKYGNFSNLLVYDVPPAITSTDMLINLGILIGLSLIMSAIILRKPDIIKVVSVAMSVALIIMAGINISGINGTLRESDNLIQAASSNMPEIELSKSGKNVVVIMMDRQIGHYVPFIMNEKPELKDSFKGFTYYSNVFSYGTFTNVGCPGLYGGYEYIPEEMNKKTDRSLEEKHNESLKVMPKIFSEAGYTTNVINPSYAGYDWIPDLTIFEDLENVDCSITNGKFALEEYSYTPSAKKQIETRKRNFFCYSMFKIAPSIIQKNLYNKGGYNEAKGKEIPLVQTVKDSGTAEGYSEVFMDSYAALSNMDTITNIYDDEAGSFNMLSNDVTHSPMLLQEPDYTPAVNVDLKDENSKRYDENGNELIIDDNYQRSHYDINMAAMIKLADWLDYLKKEDVYDNTRIIIVSDHGRDLHDNICPVLEVKNAKVENDLVDTCYFDCVLLVKDFDSHEYTVDDTLISNADVPYQATKGLIKEATNPYSGKRITSYKDENEKPELIYTMDYQTNKNNGNVFLPAPWLTVEGNIYDADSWKYTGFH